MNKRKAINDMTNDELSEELIAVEAKIELAMQGDVYYKAVLPAARAFRFALACVARKRGMLVLQSDLQEESPAPSSPPSNVVSLAAYRAQREARK